MKPRQHWIGTNIMTANNTNIFLVTNSSEDSIVAFSNIGTALEFVRDSHGDLNPEGAALVLRGQPATNKLVKTLATTSRQLVFTATAADAASNVAAIQSKLDGALQACELVGVDPSNVAKVGELRAELQAARLRTDNVADSVGFTIDRVVLHKRKHNKRS